MNNPLRYSDPTGHKLCEDMDCRNDGDKKPIRGGGGKGSGGKDDDKPKSWLPDASGNNVEFNITAGIPLENKDHATIFLLYLSLGVATDEAGGVQFYYTTLDQKYTPGSSGHMGGFSGDENGEKDSAYGLGIGGSRGIIFGNDFRTDKFLGQGDSTSIGVLPISGGVFNPRDKESNWTGVELGGGGGFTMGNVSTDTKKIGERIQLPPKLFGVCQIMGQCGMIASIPPIP